MYGPGLLKFSLGYEMHGTVMGWWWSNFGVSATPFTVESPIMVWTRGATDEQLAAMKTRLIMGNAGTFRKTGTNGTISGEVMVYDSSGAGTIDVDALGLKDGSANGSLGDVDFLLGNNARLRHSGAGETTDRSLAITGTTASATFEFAGTGTMTLASDVSLRGVSSGTLKLENATETTAVADCTGGTGVDLSFVKGPWAFGENFAAEGNVRLAGSATLTVERDLTITNFCVDSGISLVIVKPGATLAITNFTCASGATVNFRMMDPTAKVIAQNHTVSGTVKVNGSAAQFNGDGTLDYSSSLTDHMWKYPADGSWTNAVHWHNGVPDESSYVKVAVPGADYTVKVDRDELIAAGVGDAGKISVTNLVLRNESGTATLLVTNAAEMTFVAKMGTDDARPLRLETGAYLKIDDAKVIFRDRGNDTGGQSSRSPLVNVGGTVEVCGTGQLVNVGREWQEGIKKENMNGQFQFGSGRYVFRDSSRFVRQTPESWYSGCGWSTVYYTTFQPYYGYGDLKVEFLDDSRFDFSGWDTCFGANGRHVEFVADTSYTGTQAFGSNVKIANGNGLTEIFLKRGTYTLGGYYCSIATPGGDDAQSSSALFTTGRVEIASGATASVGHSSLRNMNIGQGLALTKSRGKAFVRGELLVSGEYWQQHGSFYVGAGPCAEGLVHQTAGRVRVWTTDYQYQVGEAAIGLFGGKGLYKLEGGIFQTHRNVYIGGATSNDLHWTSHRNMSTLELYHDAEGEVRVSGGTFKLLDKKMKITLGADGTGTLTLSSTGTVTAAAVIVSNTVGQAASALKFVSDSEGRFGTFDVTTLQFATGSKLVIDATEFPQNGRTRTLLSLPNPIEGFDYVKDHVEIVGNTVGGTLRWSDDGRKLRFVARQGCAIMIK